MENQGTYVSPFAEVLLFEDTNVIFTSNPSPGPTLGPWVSID